MPGKKKLNLSNRIKKLKDFFFPPDWPTPKLSQLDYEPRFLFVLTPPYSGSTALSKVLNSADGSMTLRPDGEGQWLVPGLGKLDRWDPKKYINWDSVEIVWRNKIRMVEELVGRVDIVIEKSPPHMIRSEALMKRFPQNDLIVFNRNPYANCASILHRNYSPQKKTEAERIQNLQQLASDWAFRAAWAKRNIDTYNCLNFTYEEFSNDIESTMKMTIDRIPSLTGVRSDLTIKVKDYPPQKISNQNSRQIGKLSMREREAIGLTLRKHEELLNFFGYTNDWKADIEQGGAIYAPMP
ncbi:MAG: sulfotransferase [Cyanobacteria bacterium J06641_5]